MKTARAAVCTGIAYRKVSPNGDTSTKYPFKVQVVQYWFAIGPFYTAMLALTCSRLLFLGFETAVTFVDAAAAAVW